MRLSVTAATGIILLVGLLLQGCGHKGPLVLPPPPAAAQPAQPVQPLSNPAK